MFKNEISPAPKETIDINLFFPVVAENMVFSGEVYGVPLEFDGLSLFYNPKIFNEAGKSVPTSWEELRKIAAELTVKDSSGKIQTAGVALGTTNNVDHFSDILGLMLLQNGADPANAESQLTQDAIQFYTIFATTDKVWDETLPSSTYAFATEKVAMFFAPSWRVFEIKEINPSLEFKTAPVPQLPGTQIAWASYWAESVSKKSKNTKEAWDFLKYLSSEEVVTKLYTAESNLRLFGEPYALKSLVSTLESDPYVGAFVKQGSYAKSWYLCSRTFDNGINDGVIKYYEDAINSIVSGKELQSTIKTLSSGVSQVLSRYGVKKTPTQQVSEPKQSPSTSSGTPSLPEAI
jgi:multiple sugar transport system substrate-binding protein